MTKRARQTLAKKTLKTLTDNWLFVLVAVVAINVISYFTYTYLFPRKRVTLDRQNAKVLTPSLTRQDAAILEQDAAILTPALTRQDAAVELQSLLNKIPERSTPIDGRDYKFLPSAQPTIPSYSHVASSVLARENQEAKARKATMLNLGPIYDRRIGAIEQAESILNSPNGIYSRANARAENKRASFSPPART